MDDKMMATKKQITSGQYSELLETLKQRFEQNVLRHPSLEWNDIHTRLVSQPDKIRSISLMEETGGEPDVVGRDHETGEYLFFDCAPESPKGRRSLCYDRAALESRKKFKPKTSATDLAREMGIALLTEQQYRKLQELGPVDTKTSSWIITPASMRELGGALFGDFRFGRVFIYHNGAESYYGARGFRGVLRV